MALWPFTKERSSLELAVGDHSTVVVGILVILHSSMLIVRFRGSFMVVSKRL